MEGTNSSWSIFQIIISFFFLCFLPLSSPVNTPKVPPLRPVSWGIPELGFISVITWFSACFLINSRDKPGMEGMYGGFSTGLLKEM